MITTDGKAYIKRYLAGFVPNIAQSIAFGLGSKAEAAGDTKLQFEVDRADIVLTSYDFVANKLIFKAPIPDEYAGTIYEVALYSTPSNALAGDYGSRVLTTFDSETEDWVDLSTLLDSTFTASNIRIGADGLRQAPAASGTKTDTLRDISVDLSGYSGADKFVLALNNGNTNASTIRMRLMTDSTNYYDLVFATNPVAGYQVLELNKSAAAVTGTPSWANITEIRAITIANAGGAAQVDLDGFRIDDADTINSDYVMVSRELLSTPFVKQAGRTQEIEFALDVTV